MEFCNDKYIEKIKQKDERAFEQMFEQLKVPIFNYILRMVKNMQVAEDLFGEVFIRVINSLPNIDTSINIKSWIYKIAHNLVIDHFRKQKNVKILSLDAPISANDNSRATTLKDLIGNYDNLPSKELLKKQMQKLLEEAIESLPKEQKEIFLLREYSGLSFKKISEILDCPINTALSRMQYALKALKLKLKPLYEGEI